MLKVQRYQGEPIQFTVPKSVTLEVADCPPSVKNASATDGGKYAVTTTGLKLKVPSFTMPGDKIMVNTKEGTYIGKAT